MPEKTTPAFLDRFEGEFAVLLLGEDGDIALDVPRGLLPDGVREGIAMRLTLAVDEDATTAGKQEVADLMAGLLNRNRPSR